jgi:hypothetical protein
MVHFTDQQTVDLVRDVTFELQVHSVHGGVSNLPGYFKRVATFCMSLYKSVLRRN